ncbi:MAG: thioredoxin fold domain-containing protein [Bacteroidetes bacterium]|nr:thioredoxin fold domain-containing protein [Bacteroidota bacterium]
MSLYRILSVVILIAGCTSNDATKPIVSQTEQVLSAPMSWPTFDEAVATASKTGKLMLIDIYAPWCGWCRKMQEEVYTDVALVAYVQDNFAYGRLNIDDPETLHSFQGYTLSSQELGYSLGAEGTPTTVFLQSDGTYIAKCVGYWAKDDFRKALHYVGTGAWENLSFQEFSQP